MIGNYSSLRLIRFFAVVAKELHGTEPPLLEVPCTLKYFEVVAGFWGHNSKSCVSSSLIVVDFKKFSIADLNYIQNGFSLRYDSHQQHP